MNGQTKEWVRVSHAATGTTSVTVTLVEENLTAKWSVKTYASQIRRGVAEARLYAQQAMRDLHDALDEVDS